MRVTHRNESSIHSPKTPANILTKRDSKTGIMYRYDKAIIKETKIKKKTTVLSFFLSLVSGGFSIHHDRKLEFLSNCLNSLAFGTSELTKSIGLY